MKFAAICKSVLITTSVLLLATSCKKKPEPTTAALPIAFQWEQKAPTEGSLYENTVSLPQSGKFKCTIARTTKSLDPAKVEIIGTLDSTTEPGRAFVRFTNEAYHPPGVETPPGKAPPLSERLDFGDFEVNTPYQGAQVNEHYFPEVTDNMRLVIDHMKELQGENLINHSAKVYQYLKTDQNVVVLVYQVK